MNPPFACRSCGASVMWAITAKGKRMPVDIKAVLGGNIVLRDRQDQEPEAIYIKPDPNMRRYISHFATCPQSNKWRKK